MCAHSQSSVVARMTMRKSICFTGRTPLWVSEGEIKGDSCLISCWCPAKVGLEFTCFLEIIDVPYRCNDGGCLHWADGGHREQNLSLTAGPHDVSDLSVEAF